MKFADGACSDVGRGRPENEDDFLVDREHRLYAVADGMGGHRAGEVASATAIETLRAAFVGGEPLDRAVAAANAAVFAKGADDDALRGMGTTLTAVTVQSDGTAVLGHVGDSRAYLLRDGAVTRVTDDHSLVEQLVRDGRLTPEEAQNHPQRAIITRALGVDPDVEVDTYRIALRPGDRLLICSDGLSNMLSDDTIGATLRRHTDPQQAAETLVDMANQAGGDDNITVVVLDALSDGTDGAAAPAATAGAHAVSDAPDAGLGDSSGGAALTDEDGDADAEPPLRRRHRGIRAALFWGLPIVAVVGIALGAVGWYARRTYYVGLAGDRVTLFKGVPGGLLGWDPTIARQIELTAADLTPAARADLESGHRFASRAEADRFIARLVENHDALAATTTTIAADPTSTPPEDPTGTTETTQ